MYGAKSVNYRRWSFVYDNDCLLFFNLDIVIMGQHQPFNISVITMVLLDHETITDEDREFPFGKEPVPREIRMVYATAYLERKYELQGHNPTDVKELERECVLLEMELMDIVSAFIMILLKVIF